MKLFSYVLRYDTGFAPNPYGKYCTLATCKPQIRRLAKKGDWVIGVGSKNNVGNRKLIYAMQVSEVLTFEEYNSDPRFRYKRPSSSGKAIEGFGDNIYFRDKKGHWQQRPSRHTRKDLRHDLSGCNVLIARRFYYFGANAVAVPRKYAALVCRGRGHRRNFSEVLVRDFLAWLSSGFPPGRHGKPSNQHAADELTSAPKQCGTSGGASKPKCYSAQCQR